MANFLLIKFFHVVVVHTPIAVSIFNLISRSSGSFICIPFYSLSSRTPKMLPLVMLFSFPLGGTCADFASQKWLPVLARLTGKQYTPLYAVSKVNAAKNCDQIADCETFCLTDTGYVQTKVGLGPEYCEAHTGPWMECWTKIPSKSNDIVTIIYIF